MPYKRAEELDRSPREKPPGHARDIFVKAYSSAYGEYADSSKRRGGQGREETARKIAWCAVKIKYAMGAAGKRISK